MSAGPGGAGVHGSGRIRVRLEERYVTDVLLALNIAGVLPQLHLEYFFLICSHVFILLSDM